MKDTKVALRMYELVLTSKESCQAQITLVQRFTVNILSSAYENVFYFKGTLMQIWKSPYMF